MTKLGFSPEGSLHSVIIHEVDAVMSRFHGNKTHAAKHLGVSVRTLRYWIGAYIELEQWRLTRTGLNWEQIKTLRDANTVTEQQSTPCKFCDGTGYRNIPEYKVYGVVCMNCHGMGKTFTETTRRIGPHVDYAVAGCGCDACSQLWYEASKKKRGE